MYLEKIIKKLFMRYNLARAITEECEDILKTLDDDISPRISRIDGEIRGKGGIPRSLVENIVLNREKQTDSIMKKLQRASATIEVIDELLSYLEPLERRVIKHIYFTLNDDEELCSEMMMTKQEMQQIHIKAIDKVKYKLIRHL